MIKLNYECYSITAKKINELNYKKNNIKKQKLSPAHNITTKIKNWLEKHQRKKKSEPFKYQIGHLFHKENENFLNRIPSVGFYNVKIPRNNKSLVNYNILKKQQKFEKKNNLRKRRIESCVVKCSKNIKLNNIEVKEKNEKSEKIKRRVKSCNYNFKVKAHIKFDKFLPRKEVKEKKYLEFDLDTDKIKKSKTKNIFFDKTKHKPLKRSEFNNNYFTYEPKLLKNKIKNVPNFDLETGRDFGNFYKNSTFEMNSFFVFKKNKYK